MEDTNTGKKWSQEEDEQLLRLYNDERLDIIEIAKQHRRLPRAIAVRLVSQGIITNEFEANGYSNYKNSEYYKEIVEQKKLVKKEKSISPIIKEKQENIMITINKNDYLQLKEEITEIKKDIKMLSTNMVELISMIKSVYEFEDV
jgi:RNA:NAD 2'-phosphotransferase (TPT1/KptA family)